MIVERVCALKKKCIKISLFCVPINKKSAITFVHNNVFMVYIL